MMLLGFNGGRLGKNNDPLPDSATGVWTSNEQVLAKRLGAWPAFSAIPATGLQLYLDAGLTSSYPGTGTTWFDLSGNNRHGALANGVAYNSGNGGYFAFDGQNDVVTFSGYSQPLHTQSASFTWSMFLRANRAGTTDVILGNRNPAPFVKLTPNTFEYPNANVGGAIPGGQWMHVCVTKNGSTLAYYLDASLTATNTNATYEFSSQAPFYIGSDNGTAESALIDVGQVLVYDVALASAEVTQIFDASKTRFGI